jgi:hypothetical protein
MYTSLILYSSTSHKYQYYKHKKVRKIYNFILSDIFKP